MQNQVSPELRRNTDDKLLFGVASGIADYFGIEIVLTRILFVVLGLLSAGVAIALYVIAAIVIPEQESPTSSSDAKKIRSESAPDVIEKRRQLAGWAIIAIGVLILASNFAVFWWFTFGRLWPILIIILGVAVLAGAFKSKDSGGQ